MDDVTFEQMSDEFQALESMSDRELELLLLNARRPPAGNRLDAVMENMRRVYGAAAVSRWVQRCAELGILA